MYINNSNRTLFLLTKTFPFGNGEQYITNELPYLSKFFERVIIYPNDYYGELIEHDKLLPSNIEVLNFNRTFLKFDSKNGITNFLLLVKTTIKEFFETNDKSNFFRNFRWNLIQFWTQLKLANSFEIYLKKNNLISATFYSYWFHKSAILLSILKSKKVIHEFVARAHSVDLYHNDWGIINEIIKVPPYKFFKLEHVSKLYAVSKHGYNYLCDKYPQHSLHFDYAYLGVESTDEKCEHLLHPIFHIVTCSGLDANKRVHLLAKALVNLNKPVKWTHFGDGPYREEIEKLIPAFAPGSDVQIMGQVANTDVKKYYQAYHIDLFLNLSIVEGLPVSIMEAMAFGIPILATSVYGTPEAVFPEENGFLLNVNFTIEQLTQTLNQCIGNPELLKRMGQCSLRIFEKNFNSKINYNQFANQLASL